MNTANPWESLERELHPRLEAVGFRPTDFTAQPTAPMPGVSFVAFESAYALLYCVRLGPMEIPGMTAALDFACDTMRAALTRNAANDWTRDGYVIAAVALPPASNEVKLCLRNFEQGRAICRRHVVWPESESSGTEATWTVRLDRVTVLALPEAETPPAPGEALPAGSGFIEDIHTQLAGGASYKLVAEELIRTVRAREDFHAS